MAIWQYTFHVLTKESVESLDKDMTTSDDFGINDQRYWQFEPIDRSFFLRMESIFGKGESWSKEIDIYGDQESNCFEVLFDKKKKTVLSVSFRIDFTSDYKNLLSQIIEFCIINGLVVLDESLNVVPLNLETIKNVIENAPQVNKYNQLKGEESD